MYPYRFTFKAIELYHNTTFKTKEQRLYFIYNMQYRHRFRDSLEHSKTGDEMRERASPRSRLVPSAHRIICTYKIALDILNFCMACGFWCPTCSGLRDTVNKTSTFKLSRIEINCHRRFSTPRQRNWTNNGSSYFPFFLCKHRNPHSS